MKSLARGLTVLLLLALPTAAQTAQNKKQKTDPAQQAEITALVAAVDALTSGTTVETSLPAKWEQEHFLKAEAGKTYVPFTIAIGPPNLATSGPVGVYVRAVKKGSAAGTALPPAQKTGKDAPPASYAFDQIVFVNTEPMAVGQPQRIRRALAVEPGDYDVFVAIRGAAGAVAASPSAASTSTATAPAPAPASAATTGASAVLQAALKRELTVPDFQGTELKVSSLIIASKVEVLATPLPPERQSDSPYTFQELKVTPSTDYKFTPAGSIGIILWIYGAGVDPATKKPNLKVDFSFSQKLADGEKPFKNTDPQELNPSTLPAEFSLNPGDPLRTGMEIELATFPAGEYHLEVKVADNVASKMVSRDVNFTVAAQ
jgi:hypothetical protein